jgi:hypothetical protein
MTRKFYSVTCLTCPDDDGVTYTFESREKAEDCYLWLKSEGMWFVRMWS